MSRTVGVFLCIISFYAMIYSHASPENIKTRFVVKLSLDMDSWKTIRKFYYLSSYPIMIVCNNYLQNPESNQCLHQQARYVNLGCSRLEYTLSHIASIGFK